MLRTEFSFDLPAELIAQYPNEQRSSSRLLCLDGNTGECVDRQFSDITSLLMPNDLLVINDTRVMQARLYGNKHTGGKLEVLIERVVDAKCALAKVRNSKSLKPGSSFIVAENTEVFVDKYIDGLLALRLERDDWPAIMQAHGHMPLPPYINRDDEDLDLSRYQTVYAENEGAVAAPTAGLHFDQALLDTLADQGVDIANITLHVGAGTFEPVRTENIAEHSMHSEWFEVSETVCEQIAAKRAAGGRVVAVGTTSVRSLESATDENGITKPFKGDTSIFITPGYKFRCVDAMITNFHLPESTLIMLVSAFAGYENVMHAYQHAVDERYRFFSYGDAMFVSHQVKRAKP